MGEIDAIIGASVRSDGGWRPVTSFGDRTRWRGDGNGSVNIGTAGASLSLDVRQVSGYEWPSAVSAAIPAALPAVVGSAQAAVEEGNQIHSVEAVGLDRQALFVDGVIRAVTLPEVDRGGVMVDFGAALAVMNHPSASTTQYQVWLSSDAPADLAARLARQHVYVLRTIHSATYRSALDDSGPAFADSLFLLSALAATVLAIAATAVGRVLSVRRRGYELAALEAVGVSPRTLRRATAAEQGSIFGIGLTRRAGCGAGRFTARIAQHAGLRRHIDRAAAGAGAAVGAAGRAHRGDDRPLRRRHRRHHEGGRAGRHTEPAERGAAVSEPGGVRVRCEGVVHIYPGSGEGLDDVVALRGIDLDVDPGEFVSLLGPSGSGKSTVLGLLAGMLRPSAGRVLIGPHDVGRMAPRSLARLRGSVVALVLQNPSRNLLAYATVRQNLAFAAGPSGKSSDALLERLGLAGLADRVTGRLSDGEQQCVAIVAALSSGAQLVLADEPTSQLDAIGREHVMELLTQVHVEFGCTVVLVTHDSSVAARSPRTVTIRDGRVGSEGVHGREYVVVGRDGSLQLPTELLEEFPAGTLLEVRRDGAQITLAPRSEGSS